MSSSMILTRGKGKINHYMRNSIRCNLVLTCVCLLFVYSDEGKVRKVLKVEPLPDGSGHFFNLSKLNIIFSLILFC